MSIDLYEKTVKRLARAGVKDPTAQIIYLAEEIDRYRAKIHALEKLLRGQPPRDEKQDAMLCAVLDQVAEKFEKAKELDYVRRPLAWALHEVWKIIDSVEETDGKG